MPKSWAFNYLGVFSMVNLSDREGNNVRTPFIKRCDLKRGWTIKRRSNRKSIPEQYSTHKAKSLVLSMFRVGGIFLTDQQLDRTNHSFSLRPFCMRMEPETPYLSPVCSSLSHSPLSKPSVLFTKSLLQSENYSK